MTYQVGQIVEFPQARGIWRRDWEPSWFILTTPAQSEAPASAWLMAQGCAECWFPTEVRWRRIPRGKRSKVKYLAPIVPRYVFALMPAEPHWDVLFSRARGKVSGVVSRYGIPAPISDADMAGMREVPQRLANAREVARQARTIRAGDRASVTSGPLAGWTVDVESIHAGIARIVVPLLGRSSVEISEEHLVKTQPVAK